jgi:polyhydroxyalkanoate synthesis repressor PhaR
MSDHVLLKKYANRRLYDTVGSRYVTLEEVAQMIKEGRTVKAEDAKSGEDVTAFILTQIVLESARQKNILLPPPLLHVIIRYGDNQLNEFFDKYLEQIMKNYLTYKSQVDEQFKRWMSFGLNFSEMAKESMKTMPPFSFFGPKKEEKPKE